MQEQHINQQHDITLRDGLALFQEALEGENHSPSTIRAYKTDVKQFLDWLEENGLCERPEQMERLDITEHMTSLRKSGLSGATMARKLSAIKEYILFLVNHNYLVVSPAAGVKGPKREQRTPVFLRPDEYRALLAEAASNPRDLAILQVFLQTGIRVGELCALKREDIDLQSRTLTVRQGKGQSDRTVELEKKGIAAIKNYLEVRPSTGYDEVFLNCDGEPISARGVRKMVAKYRERADINKHASCHSLRHTFSTYKAEKGVSPFQLQAWLGHKSLATTQIYVHLGRSNGRKVMEQTAL